MCHLQLTILALALWKLVSGHFIYCVSFSVAGITEMRVAPAKPNGATATEFALEFNVIRTVLRTVRYAAADHFRRAFRTQKCLLVQVVYVELGALSAILTAHKLRVLALEALVV